MSIFSIVKRNPVRKYLWRKLLQTETRDGTSTVLEALDLQRLYPDLSGPELIRLAYWGASGSAVD